MTLTGRRSRRTRRSRSCIRAPASTGRSCWSALRASAGTSWSAAWSHEIRKSTGVQFHVSKQSVRSLGETSTETFLPFCRHNASDAARWSGWTWVHFRHTRENGGGRRRREVHRKRRIQGTPVRHFVREREDDRQLRLGLRAEPPLPGDQVAPDAAAQTIHRSHQTTEFRAIEGLAGVEPSPVDIRRDQFQRIYGKIEAKRASSSSLISVSIFQDEEFNEMLYSAKRIDFLYGQYFDEEIVNDDLAAALEQMLVHTEKSETEPLWAPSSWIQ